MGKEHENNPAQLTVEEVINAAREILLEGGQHPATVLVEGSGRIVGVALEVDPTPDQRLIQMFALGATLARGEEVGELRQVFFVSEAWMSQAKKDKPPKHRPSQDPNRVEVLIISHWQAVTPTTDMVTFEMVRDQAGKLTDLKELYRTGVEQLSADSPLLDAFVAGYEVGRGGLVP